MSLVRFFAYEHLPLGAMRGTSKQITKLAKFMDQLLPESAEKTAGMRKLLEAKDCFVRAAMEAEHEGTLKPIGEEVEWKS